MLRIDVLRDDCRIESVVVPAEITDVLFHLPENSDDYFVRTDISEDVDVELLIASHIRSQGVVNANALMKQASEGKGEKRMPLRVKRIGSRVLVLDGNSTFVNAKLCNWRSLPCHIVS
jgi:hypothetical protein